MHTLEKLDLDRADLSRPRAELHTLVGAIAVCEIASEAGPETAYDPIVCICAAEPVVIRVAASVDLAKWLRDELPAIAAPLGPYSLAVVFAETADRVLYRGSGEVDLTTCIWNVPGAWGGMVIEGGAPFDDVADRGYQNYGYIGTHPLAFALRDAALALPKGLK